MTDVKHILFFDEGKVESTGNFRINKLIESCLEFSTIVEFHTQLNYHFDFLDGSGNEIKLLFEKEKVSYIFIHHSFNEPTMIQSNHFDILHDILGDKLIIFSGESYNDLNKGRLRRDDVYLNFRNFLDLSIKINEYRLEVFTERNFKRKIIDDYFEFFKKSLEEGKDIALDSLYINKLSILLNFDLGILVQRLQPMDELDIIEFFETKIGTI